jgi:hypothetical protein
MSINVRFFGRAAGPVLLSDQLRPGRRSDPGGAAGLILEALRGRRAYVAPDMIRPAAWTPGGGGRPAGGRGVSGLNIRKIEKGKNISEIS